MNRIIKYILTFKKKTMENTVYLTESLNFNLICRSCLANKGEMRSLFGTCLDDMLKTVANIVISEQDGLPQQMCVRCVLQVSRAFTFRQQCKKSDDVLRLYLKQEIMNVIDEQNESETIVQNIDQPQQINDRQLEIEEQNNGNVFNDKELQVLNEKQTNDAIYMLTNSNDQGDAFDYSVDDCNSVTIPFELENNIDDMSGLDMISINMSPTPEHSVEIMVENYGMCV